MTVTVRITAFRVCWVAAPARPGRLRLSRTAGIEPSAGAAPPGHGPARRGRGARGRRAMGRGCVRCQRAVSESGVTAAGPGHEMTAGAVRFPPEPSHSPSPGPPGPGGGRPWISG